MSIAVAIIGPAMALVGVLAGLWVGEHRWRREQARLDSAKFKGLQQDAYLELWGVVEEVQLKMRAALEELGPETFSGLLTDVNSFVIRHGVYIEDSDRQLVLEYLFWLNEYLRLLAKSPRGRELIELTAPHGISAWDFGGRLELIGELENRINRLRDQLRERIKQIVGAEPNRSSTVRPSAALLVQLRSLVEELESARKTSPMLERTDTHEEPDIEVDWDPSRPTKPIRRESS
ncbi:hypothetical protein [Nocardia sp. CDC160]|uniref:hypothetical protein n=1 Tax=Nocardia sp. CDC160 TaxID=3112166 RepID=UPI002DB92334|nr:hypothetical protein [Nocardia sp. CDC160]MEC3919410.1 hypothetical protein [Nocardia sp. CDC160]